MPTVRTTLLATAMISTGLLSSAGVALAGDAPSGHGSDSGSNSSSHHDGTTVQEGLINSSGFAPNTTGDLCNNNVPTNVLGVQVPVQDLAGALPILSKAGHGNSATNAKSCDNPIHAVN